MPGRLRCSLLCEDVGQEQLFRPLLEALLHRHIRIRVEPRKPHGGFTFVLSNLKKSAQYILRHPNEDVALLVVVDGDRTGFRGRLAEVRAALREVGIHDEKPARIAICVPTRNVETWKLWLCGARDLDEIVDNKARYQQEHKSGVHRSQLVEAWLGLTKEQLAAASERLPSLVHGRAEIERLRSLARR